MVMTSTFAAVEENLATFIVKNLLSKNIWLKMIYFSGLRYPLRQDSLANR